MNLNHLLIVAELGFQCIQGSDVCGFPSIKTHFSIAVVLVTSCQQIVEISHAIDIRMNQCFRVCVVNPKFKPLLVRPDNFPVDGGTDFSIYFGFEKFIGRQKQEV